MPKSLVITLLYWLPGLGSPVQERAVTIYLAQPLGNITFSVGTNAGPHALRNSNLDFTDLYRQLGIQAIRAHDYYGPCDWGTIFPNWSADPNQPSSYDFAASDTAISKIVSNGFQVLFRLGTSWRGTNPLPTNDPPGTIRNASGMVIHTADTTDFKKFAEICKHIVMHYNDGWANGFHYNITHWEVWNEPSLSAQFWNGTPLQFQQMFTIVLKALKAYNANLQVGGPAQEGHVTLSYERNLLAYCQSHGAPLDFYSYHSYGGEIASLSPWDIGRRAQVIRGILDGFGYNHTKIICDEYNAGIDQSNFANSGYGAAFYASALIYMVENGVSAGYQYRGDDHPLGLITESGTLKIAGETFKAWKSLTALPVRLTTTGSDTFGFTVMATKDSAEQTIRLLLANYPATSMNLKMKLRGFSWPGGTPFSCTCRAIDNFRRLARIDSTIRITTADSLVFDITMPGGCVYLLECRRLQPTHVRDPQLFQPATVQLLQNYPNPFNAQTTIRLLLAKPDFITLKLFNLGGQEITTLIQGELTAGEHALTFDAQGLPSGCYFYRLQTGRHWQQRRMVVVE